MVLDTSNLIYSSSNLYDPYYPIEDLLANNSYTFYVIPFYTNIPEYYQYIQVSTLAVIGSLDIAQINSESVLLKWDRLAYAYNYVDITWTNVNLISYYNAQARNFNNIYVTGELTHLTQTSNLITGLGSNTPYFFTVTAYNSIGVPTPPIITDTVYTLATVGNISCGINNTRTSSITLNWKKENYTFVKLYWTPTLLDGASGSFLTTNDLENVATNPFLNPMGVSSNIYDTAYTVSGLNSNVTYNFALYAFNSNNRMNSNCSTFQWVTTPNVGGVYITNITNNSVRVNWSYGNYYSIKVRVFKNNVLEREILLIRNTFVDIYNLLPNTRYKFGVVPYTKPMTSNTTIIRGVTVYSDTIVTLGELGDLSLSSITNKSVVVSWSKSNYTYLNLYYSSINNQQSNIYNISSNQSNIALNNLYGNSLYTVELTPYNLDNINSMSSNISFYTLPNIPYFRTTDVTSNSIQLEWGSDNIYQSYTFVDIYWNSGSLLKLTSGNTLISGLDTNRLYNFTLIPYNTNYVAGSNLLLNVATFGTIINLRSSNITTNSIDFKWTNSNTGLDIYNYVNNYKSSNITINNLIANTNYEFKFYSSNVTNTITAYPNTINVKTLPLVNSIGVNNITKNSMTVNWDTNSLYEYIKLSYIEQVSKLTSNIFITSGTNNYTVGNLSPNAAYLFSITPYNNSIVNSNLNIPDTFGKTITNNFYIYTLSDLTSATVTGYTTNSISVAWTYPFNGFDSITITWTNILTNTSNTRDGIRNKNSYDITDGSIYPNQTYIVNIISNNVSLNTGTSLYALKYIPSLNQYTNNIITKPSAGNIFINSIATDSINVNWGRTDYFAYVDVYLYEYNMTINQSNLTYYGNSYVFNNLISNKIYNVYIYPFSSAIPSDIGLTSTLLVNTVATVGQVSLIGMTDTSINISWGSGTYSTVTIQWKNYNSSNTIYTSLGASSFDITGLVSNKLYDIAVYPNNSNYLVGADPIGTPSLFSIVTYATIGSAFVNSFNDFNANLIWFGGTYSAISITWTDVFNNNNIINPDPSLASYTLTNLYPNTSNIFRIIPYNSANTLGFNNSLYTDPIVTLAYITNPSISNIRDSSVQVKFNDVLYAEYSNYDISLYNAANTLITKNNRIDVMSPIINTGIMPNANYSITLLPYNSVNVPNNSYNKILTFTSLATIGNITSTTINSSSIAFSWDKANSTYSIVNWDPPNLNGINKSEIIYGNSYTVNNLGSNTQYNINIIPYNTVNNSNIYNYNNLFVYTLPVITFASSSIVNNNTININWQGYYSSVDVIITNSRNPTVFTYTVYYPTSTFQYSPLNPDTRYTTQLKPYNPDGANGITTTLINYTLPFIYTFNIDFYTDTTVKLNWANNANVSSGGIGISWTPPDSFTNELIFKTVDNYLVTGLRANTNYTFTAKSYNSATPPETGNILTNSVVTLPNVVYVTATLDTTFATHYVNGGYSNLLISWSNLLDYNSPTYSQYFLYAASHTTYGLIPDTLYKFTYTPYNLNNIVGTTYTISQIAAAATVGDVRVYEYSSNLMKLTWIDTGYRYHYVYNTYNGVYTNKIYGNSNTITGLTPNTTYYMYAIPVNSFDIQNNAGATFVRECTLPLVNSITPQDISAYTLNLNINSYCDHAVVSCSNLYSFTINGPFMNSNVVVPISDLYANTTYYFSVTPYNTSNVVGQTYTIRNVLTKSIINNITISNIGSNQFTIDWFSTSTYKSLDVTWSSLVPSGLSGGDRLSDLIKPQLLGPANNNTFYPNTLYKVQVIPSVDLTLGIGSPLCNVCTLPVIGATLSSGTILDTTAFISWTNPTINAQFSSWTNTGYSYVNVYWTSNSIDVQSYSNLYDTSYTIRNLTPNKTYNSFVIPYNLSNLHGVTINKTFTTLSTIYNATVTMTYDSTYTSTANLTWSGVFDYVKYYYTWTDYNGALQTTNRVLVNSSLSPNSVNVATGLLPNINYTFIIEPYSSSGLVGVVKNVKKYSLPYLTSAGYSSSNDTSVTLSWSTGNQYDRYSNVAITTVPDTGTSFVVTPPFVYRNLIANTSYTFTVTPVNNDAVFGRAITLPTISTYATLYTANLTQSLSSFDNITFTGVYSYVIIKYNNSYTPRIYDGSIPTSITSLLPNTNYTVVFIPYNSLGTKPDDVFLQNAPYTITTSTLASVTILTTVPTINTITITWSKSNNNYVYLIITWVAPDGTNFTSGRISYTLNDNGSYTLNNLISYTTYQITVTVYNMYDLPNQLTPFSVTTLVYITSVLPMEVGTDFVKIKWVGEYNTVDVYSSYNTTRVRLNPGVTNYRFDNTNGNIFSANTSYVFYVIPYDTQGNPGVTASVSIRTLPNLSSSTSVTGVGSVTATVNWSGNFANVNVTSILVQDSGESALNTVNVATNSYQFTTLIPNKYHKFTITPFSTALPYSDGSVFNQGASVTTSPNILTLGLIRNLRIIETTINNISLQWDPDLFTSVNIQLATGGSTVQFINNLIGNVYDFSSYLSANTVYTIRLYAVNSAGVVNTVQPASENIIVGNTLPVVTSFTVSAVTANSITVAWVGNVTKVNLLWIGTDGTQGSIIGYTGYTYNTFTTGSLSINVTYTFTLTPFNASSVSGVVRNLQATTLATIGTITPGVASINSVDMSWSSGTYSYIVFSWTGSSTGRSINVLSSPYTILGLLINGVYTITAIPYNKDNVAGTPVVSGITVYTLPLIDSFNIINITNNNMTLTWSGSYTRLDITWTGTAGPTSGVLTNVSGNTYDFGGYLTPGATYTFALTPYNSNGVANPFVSGSLSATTLS